MPNKKILVPSASEFMKKKAKNQFTEPPWIFLEREMRANAEKGIKPYNKKVGDWLVYLKDLKEHFRNKRMEKYKELEKNRGAPWFMQFSLKNLKEATINLQDSIHTDMMNQTYTHTSATLRNFGVNVKFPEGMLEAAIKESKDDPGLFLWSLFTLCYKQPPSQLLPKYDINAQLIMSAIMFNDLEGCIKLLDLELTKNLEPPPPKPTPKKKKPSVTPNVKFGIYLAKMKTVKCRKDPPKKKQLPDINYNFKMSKDEDFEALARQSPEISLNKRRKKYDDAMLSLLKYKHKFWEAPEIRPKGSKAILYAKLLKMLKKKPIPTYLNNLLYENIQCHIGTVTYSGNQPQYQIHNYTSLPTGYIVHNAGLARLKYEYATHILNYVRFPRDTPNACENTCNCMDQWTSVKKHLDDCKCKCGHHFCFGNKPDGKPLQQYFKPPTKYSPYEINIPSIFQFGSNMQDLIKSQVDRDLQSTESGTDMPSVADLAAMPTKELLKSLLENLMDSELILPHLPKAYLLPNLLAWTRKRIKGPIGPNLKRRLDTKSNRDWSTIDSLDFRARAHQIPYTQATMPKYDTSHRALLQDIREKEFNKFARRTRYNQLRKSNLLWPTMRYDDYPSEKFLRTYSAYMPQPEKPVYIYNPPKRVL